MDRPIKITHIINDIVIGGAEVVVADICRLIDKTKFDVSVCYLSDYAVENPERGDLSDLFAAASVPLVNLGNGGKFKGLSDLWKLVRALRKERSDIVHCHLPVSIIYGSIAARLAGVRKIIIHEHNSHNFYSWKIRLGLWIARSLSTLSVCYGESVEREIYGQVHVLTAPVESVQGRSVTIRNGIDLAKIDEAKRSIDRDVVRAEFGVMPKDRLITSISRLIAWKGQENLVRAIAAMPVRMYLRALIVGSGADRESLEKLTLELGILERVMFAGDRRDVYNILAGSDIFSFVLNYPKGFTSEALGIAALEAMAMGLPTVVADIPATRQLLSDGVNCVIVPPEDPEALAKAFERLLFVPALRVSIGAGGRKYVEENYSWSAIIKIYESLYDSLYRK